MSEKIYLCNNNNFQLFLEDNNLYFTILSTGFNNEDYLNFLEQMQVFFEICINKSSCFNFIIDISQTNIMLINNVFYYAYNTSIFLKKYDDLFKQYLNLSIVIIKNETTKNIFEYLFKFYKPVKPLKFKKNYNELEQYINLTT